MTRLYLFDIDGTLVRGDGAGRRAMEAAFEAVLGEARAMAGIRFDGATDRAIVRHGLELRGRVADDGLVSELLAAYLSALDAEMVARQPFRALPGAAPVARALAAHGVVGLGTGNIEPAAERKVRAVGMGELFRFGGYGSDAEVRSELLAIGAARGAALAGVALDRCEVVVIGDTERDIAAARAIGARVVAVATGGTSAEVLAASEPDALIDSLAEVDAVVAMILGL
ncbi:MAG: haloacid dehalogenase-like hydrolase [Myxococcota bacterium]